MEPQKTLEILKMAILMEKEVSHFIPPLQAIPRMLDLKNIFLVMAEEETKHVKFLSDQYVHYEKVHTFLQVNLSDLAEEGFAKLIMTEDLKQKISSAGFEAAAISAAIDF